MRTVQAVNLFGEIITLEVGPMRKRGRSPDPKPQGHAWTPGTGPAGETCGTCKHCYANELAKTYYKCLLTRAFWTGGRKTDIRKRDPACKMWEAEG